MEKNDGGPAFPRLESLSNKTPAYAVATSAGGMTLRDYFAAKAMQGMQANVGANKWTPEHFAESAYKCADAMLKARSG